MCLILHNCGHESDWNTLFQWFGRVGGYLLSCAHSCACVYVPSITSPQMNSVVNVVQIDIIQEFIPCSAVSLYIFFLAFLQSCHLPVQIPVFLQELSHVCSSNIRKSHSLTSCLFQTPSQHLSHLNPFCDLSHIITDLGHNRSRTVNVFHNINITYCSIIKSYVGKCKHNNKKSCACIIW